MITDKSGSMQNIDGYSNLTLDARANGWTRDIHHEMAIFAHNGKIASNKSLGPDLQPMAVAQSTGRIHPTPRWPVLPLLHRE